MDSIELYRQLLGVTTPWSVERVEMDVPHLRVDVYLEHASGARFMCPECGVELSVYDHTDERTWRHLDSCHFQTLLHARPPRVQCPAHGVRQARLPWAEPGGRFTNLFEALAIDVLLATDVKNAATILGITWDEAWNIQERAVRRGRRSKINVLPAIIGVDEKAIAKGHRYMTLVCDLQQATVEYIAAERKQASLQSYFDGFEPEALEAVQAISMDMWPPYINACLQAIPGAERKIVFDRFHIMRYVIDAVDAVRKREHKALLAAEEQVPVAVQRRERAGQVTRALRRAQGRAAQDRSRVGTEGVAARAVAFHPRGLGRAILATLVLLGHAQPAAADRRGGQDDRAAPAQRAHVLQAPHHQRRGRGAELEDRHDPEARLRLPQSREIQDRRVLPLRWAQPLAFPVYPLKCPKAHIFLARMRLAA